MYAVIFASVLSFALYDKVDQENSSTRARAALALAAAGTESVSPVPPKTSPVAAEHERRQSENYTRMYDLALAENRIFVVHVGAGRSDLAEEFDDCYHATVQTFPGVVGKGIVIARGIAGRLMKVAVFPFDVSLDAIKGVISARQSAVPFAYGGSSRAKTTQGYYSPPGMMYQRYAPMRMMSGGACAGGG